MQCRRRDVLEGSSPAATGAWSIANGRSSGRTTPFGLFAQGGGNNGGFSRGMIRQREHLLVMGGKAGAWAGKVGDGSG